MKIDALIPVITVVGILSVSANAATILGLYDTGVDNTGTTLADGSNDTHYVINTNPDGTNGATPVITDHSVFPISNGQWLAGTGTSKWISPRFNNGGAAGGIYEYSTTFDLTGLDRTTARITGGWASDNGGLDILINGTSTGQTNGGFGGLSNFMVNSGFVSGVNTLSFRLNNAGTGHTGLRVSGISGTADVIPEPSGAILVALGGGMLLVRRRK